MVENSQLVKVKGYILACIGAATYGLNPLFTLPLYDAGMTAGSVLLFRYLVAMAIMGIMIWARGRSFNPGKKNLPLLGVFGFLVAMSSLTLFVSYEYMDAGIASSLLFVYPIMVAILMAVFFHERPSLLTYISILGALCGIALLYKGEDGGTLSTVGTIMVMISSLTYALYIVGINRDGLQNIPTLTITFWILTFGAVFLLLVIMFGDGISVPPSDRWWLWGNILCLALFPTAISFLCTTAAIHYIGSTPTAILGALEPVTAVVIGITVFNETMTPRIFLGLILIIVAVTIVVAAPSIHHPLQRVKKLFPRIKKRRR